MTKSRRVFIQTMIDLQREMRHINMKVKTTYYRNNQGEIVKADGVKPVSEFDADVIAIPEEALINHILKNGVLVEKGTSGDCSGILCV